MSTLGIDVGEKKIGLAVGQGGWAWARPALLVTDWAEAWPVITALIESEEVSEIVVGLPRQLSGEVGTQALRTRDFISQLRQHVAVPIVERDERHSSQAVQREQTQAGKQLKRGEEDSLAAQLLVESYLTEKST